MKSIHYNQKLLECLDYSADEFLDLMFANGIINLFSNDGLENVYLKNVVDVSKMFNVEKEYY